MNAEMIFGVQLILSTFVFGFLAKWYVMPWLKRKPLNEALMPLVAPHAFRHIGLSFLVSGVTASSLPAYFANPAAYGDLAAAILAILALFALRLNWKYAIPAVLVFNIVGTIDLINALRHAEVIAGLGATWYIPTFFVPLLLVTHAMIFLRLSSEKRRGKCSEKQKVACC